MDVYVAPQGATCEQKAKARLVQPLKLNNLSSKMDHRTERNIDLWTVWQKIRSCRWDQNQREQLEIYIASWSSLGQTIE